MFQFLRLTAKCLARFKDNDLVLSYHGREIFWRSQNHASFWLFVTISDVYVIFSYNRIQFFI